MCEFRYVAFPCLPVACQPLLVGCPDGVKIPGGLKTPLILYHRKNMIAFLVFRRELWQVRESNPLPFR